MERLAETSKNLSSQLAVEYTTGYLLKVGFFALNEISERMWYYE